MNPATLRAWWWRKQGLDGQSQHQTAADVLAQTGWARSVGGAAPYLTLFARAGISREQADLDAAQLKIHELPSARGCTHVLPQCDFALGLQAGRGFADESSLKSAQRVGVTQEEIAKLKAQILQALQHGPLDPAQLRDQLKVPSLGDAGKKAGLSTPLPVALTLLQQTGHLRRISTNGRFDQERYRYALWQPYAPVPNAYTELAQRYFRWIGPATLKEFQWFSGLGVKASLAATEPLSLVDIGDDRKLLPEDEAEFAKFTPPTKPQYALVSSLDNLILLRRNLTTLLDPADLAHEVAADKSRKPVGTLTDLPSHAIFDRGRLIGLWEFDPAQGTIAWSLFRGKPDHALRETIEKTALFVREQLGDARSFSLDSPQSRAPRIAALRRHAT